MSIYGISGLVDGFINGRNVRNGWQDRKDDKARQKRMDELVFTQDARSAEEHARRMKVYDENSSDWERGRADNDAVRKIYEDGEADYKRQQQEAPAGANGEGMGATDGSSVSTRGAQADPVAGVAENLGIPMGAIPNRFADSMPTPEELQKRYGSAPPQTQGQKVAVRADASAGLGVGGGGPSSTAAMGATPSQWPVYGSEQAGGAYTRGPVGMPYIDNSQPARGASGSWGGPADMTREAVLSAAAAMQPNRNHSFGASMADDMKEGGKRIAAGVGNVAKEAAIGIPNRLNTVINPALRYVTGGAAELPLLTGNGLETVYQSDLEKEAGAKAKPTAADAMKSLSSDYMGAVKPTGPRIGAEPPPAAKASVQAAGEALASTSPATQEALQAAASTAGAMGVKPTEKAGKEHGEKFAKSFNDYYLKNVAPKVMEEYMRQGDFDKAAKFQEFLDRAETRAGMENWVKAAHAVTLGDYETFAENMLEAYNRLDYFPDGTTIVKDQSGITYGKDGQPSGARITFKDEASGDTWEKVYGSVDDMVKEGITLLAPEVAFEHYAAQNEASKPKVVPVDPAKQQQDLDKRVDDAAKIIYESSVGLDGAPTVTYEEARQQAAAALMGGQNPQQLQGPPAPPPVAYRPAG